MLNFIQNINILDNKLAEYGKNKGKIESYLPDNIQKYAIEQQENSINSKIDEPVYQGDYEDCWLMAAVLSMSFNEVGSKVIEEIITANDNGSVEITFDGINRTYSITAEEIEEYNLPANIEGSLYSTGDDDMLAIELGVEKTIEDPTVNSKYSVKEGGNPYFLYKLFAPENMHIPRNRIQTEQAFSHFQRNSDKCSMSIGIMTAPVCDLKYPHSYAVKEVSGNKVIIIDPWNSTQEITVDKQELINNYDHINIVFADFE